MYLHLIIYHREIDYISLSKDRNLPLMWSQGCLVIKVFTQIDLYLYSKAYENIHMVYDYRLNLAVRTPQACLWEESEWYKHKEKNMEREFPLIIFISAVWVLTIILITGFGLYYKKTEKASGTRKSYKGLTAIALLSFLYPCIIGILLLISVGYINLDI